MPPPSNTNLKDLTPEEESLIELYATVRKFEKLADAIKARAAVAKLKSKDVNAAPAPSESLDTTSSHTITNTVVDTSSPFRKKSSKKRGVDMEGVYGAKDDYDEEAVHANNLEEPMDAIDTQQQMEEEEVDEETKLAELQGEGATISAMPVLKRAKKDSSKAENISLLQPGANMVAVTPLHEFSESLQLTPHTGTVLYPGEKDDKAASFWTPPQTAKSCNEGALEIDLQNFNLKQRNQTLAIKFSAALDSNRFSLNIATLQNDDYQNILFHFNPRQHQKGGQLILNSRQGGYWGQGVTTPLSELPLIFGQTVCSLIIQLVDEGFDVFVNQKHVARMEHRVALPTQPCTLKLQFPSTDDYGAPESWNVYKVWWGRKAPMAQAGDTAGLAGVNSFFGLHQKKLFISGLSKVSDDRSIEVRRADLERAFRKYGGARGAIVTAPKDQSYAFVEVESESQADLALAEMSNQYRINRAWKNRFDAMEEEKEAAARQQQGQENSEWD